MNGNTKIAAAVAAVLASAASGAALAAPPTLAQAQNPSTVLYIAGSSAAKNAILAALEVDVCGAASNSLIFSSTTNTNFFAVSCAPAASTGITGANGTNVFTMYYRAEGGSVVGALPIASGSPIAQLNLSAASCSGNQCTVAVSGNSAANGFNDTFGNTTRRPVQLGVTDVEPTAFVGDNYPTQYSPAVYGTANAASLAGLTATPVFQQVFGIFVNTTGLNAPISLSKEAVAGLLNGNITDWSNVEDAATHARVASSTVPVKIINREAGSGSRTAASIYFLDDECNPNNTGVADNPSDTNYFSTGNVLSAAGTTKGAITYASVDNSPAAGLTLALINNVQPTNLAAAQGSYDFWYEATLVSTNAALTAPQASLVTFLTNDFQTLNTAPHSAQVLAIPGNNVSTTPSLPVAATANRGVGNSGTTIYINPFSRSGSSCSVPASFL